MLLLGVQPADPRGVPAGVAHLEGVGAAAGGPGGQDEAGKVLQALHREGLQERDAGKIHSLHVWNSFTTTYRVDPSDRYNQVD